ncbi:MAG TPA: hypothetical protein VKH81_00250 [Candidatus Angelobacter sp.]|nr:hypothetical protein [Candidatus Angelobacter sp.]
MRLAWVKSKDALRLRMTQPQQVAQGEPEAEMPPYMESFLASLRLLIGVPFEYLVPDPRLLPDESIRFFYLDRSWADRVVDGAVAVGKIGTREQAHHQAHAPAVQQQLDVTERIVRQIQMRKGPFGDLKSANDSDPATNGTAQVITGFLLRSAAVSGWPAMDVRAYSVDIPEILQPWTADAQKAQLKTLRLERLSPSVMIALFQGIPQLVTIEEPHHGVQFGVEPVFGGFQIDERGPDGNKVKVGTPPNQKTKPVPVHVRQSNSRVLSIASLRRALFQVPAADHLPPQTGGASFAVEVLNPPWRQRFEGTQDNAGPAGQQSSGFLSSISIAVRVTNDATKVALQSALQSGVPK